MITRRGILAGAGAAAAQVLFSRTVYGNGLLQLAQPGLAAAPGAIDLTLTAMTPHTLRIGIAPATAEAHAQELGVDHATWPAPMEAPGPAHAHTVPWGAYSIRINEGPLRIAVLEGGIVRQEISFSLDSTDVHFPLAGPVFGLGEGVHPFDRRGTRDSGT